MNEHEIERIAAAMNQLRPDWPTAQLRTLLKDPKVTDRPRRDVTVALAWVACESGTANPYRVLEAGPWWRAAGVDGAAHQREPYDKGVTCHTCSLPEAKCRRLWSDDHPYVSVAEYAKTVNRDPGRIARILEAVKGEKQPMRTPEPLPDAAALARDHEGCEADITEAMAHGKPGKAEFIATRCDREHGDLTPTEEPADA